VHRVTAPATERESIMSAIIGRTLDGLNGASGAVALTVGLPVTLAALLLLVAGLFALIASR